MQSGGEKRRGNTYMIIYDDTCEKNIRETRGELGT
jgi:hypothetical protein